jgi:release factor glutamine methyltransferase
MSEAEPDRAAASWTVLRLLQWTAGHFEEQGIETARLDAEVLLAHALDVSRLQLYLDYEKPVSEVERARYRELVQRRGRDRVPISHLVGVREFWSLPIQVTPDVLTPRPETETLVEAALASIPDPEAEIRILDLGTGSGAIALALARERPRALLTASDISISALKVARETAEKLQLSEQIRFVEGSVFDAVSGEEFDLIVSNPPYIARRDRESLPRELSYEPEEALFGGDDGLEVIRPLVARVRDHLAPGAVFALELDPAQAEAVASSCREAGLNDVEILKDLAQRARVVKARRGFEQ